MDDVYGACGNSCRCGKAKHTEDKYAAAEESAVGIPIPPRRVGNRIRLMVDESSLSGDGISTLLVNTLSICSSNSSNDLRATSGLVTRVR